MKRTNTTRLVFLLVAVLIASLVLPGCGPKSDPAGSNTPAKTITITDQMGRTVEVPAQPEKISALHHFGGKIVFALGQQDQAVDQVLYGMEGEAMAKVNPKFAALPLFSKGKGFNVEGLAAQKPQVAFVYTSFEKDQMQQLENAGIKVVAIQGETLEESYEAVRLMAKVLGCEERGEAYIKDCQKLITMVSERVSKVPEEQRPQVMFCGPKDIFTVASGEMLQDTMIEIAGGKNVAKKVKGFWASVSPEQVVAWQPDVIILGSSLDMYTAEDVLKNSSLKSVKAVQNQQVYTFPSNIGWWDYPAPHCVLGIVYLAKTLYPEEFKDVDVMAVADDFYQKYLGYSFTDMGGKLPQAR